MAKVFNKVFELAKETAYSTGDLILNYAASLNSVVRFNPLFEAGGTTKNGAGGSNENPRYEVQRLIRIKGKEYDYKDNTTATALGFLDQFEDLNWDTIGIKPGNLKAIGLKLSWNEQFNIDNMGEGAAKELADTTLNTLVSREELLLEKAITANGTLPAPETIGTGSSYWFDLIGGEGEVIENLVDDFKAMTDRKNIVIVLHPSVARKVAAEIGTKFYHEMPIYRTGLTTPNSINGFPVIINKNLNKFDGVAGTDVVGAVIMDIEALAARYDYVEKPVDQTIGLTRYVGKGYYEIQEAIDKDRIKVLTFTRAALAGGATTKSKKVDD